MNVYVWVICEMYYSRLRRYFIWYWYPHEGVELTTRLSRGRGAADSSFQDLSVLQTHDG